MNNLETAIPFMKKIAESLGHEEFNLNEYLSKIGVSKVDFENEIMRIEEQIKSAETKYTIAFVGTFKTGKSTIINSLLDLHGDLRLSSEYDPDTAKCVRLMKKERMQRYDAEVIFSDTYQTEQITWREAKKYSSQVALDNSDDETRKKADKIEEIRYYIDNPFLDVCNILDLPGTGTGSHSEHTDVTDRKIMEADCIFWVVSTDAEPDRQSILNLEKFSTKMLPIINVWQCEAEDISSPLTPDDIKKELLDKYSTYFASAEDPIYYYAKEIDLAQQEHRELKEEWGKEAFANKVEEILTNIQSGDRMKRIKKQISLALNSCSAKLKDLREDQALIAVKESEENEDYEIKLIESKLRKRHDIANGDTKEHAKKAALEILDIFTMASDSFIENKMQGINWKALFNKKGAQEDMKREFETNYVKINSGWLNKHLSVFSDDVTSILNGTYSDFAIDIKEMESSNGSFAMSDNDLSGFIDSMAKIISDDMAKRVIPTILAVIAGGIMMLIPGGLVYEALATVVVGGISAAKGITNDEKLLSKINGIKSAAQVQIRQQRAGIITSLNEEGRRGNDTFCEKIGEEIGKRRKENSEKRDFLRVLDNDIKRISELIDSYDRELQII